MMENSINTNLNEFYTLKSYLKSENVTYYPFINYVANSNWAKDLDVVFDFSEFRKVTESYCINIILGSIKEERFYILEYSHSFLIGSTLDSIVGKISLTYHLLHRCTFDLGGATGLKIFLEETEEKYNNKKHKARLDSYLDRIEVGF